jgi:hypothetical protein
MFSAEFVGGDLVFYSTLSEFCALTISDYQTKESVSPRNKEHVCRIRALRFHLDLYNVFDVIPVITRVFF